MKSKLDVLKAIVSAWCERKDIDEVLSHLTEDVEWHYAAVIAPPVFGKAGARKFLEDYGAKVKNPNWRIFNYAEGEDSLLVEGVDEFELEAGGRRFVPYMGVFEFEGDKIKAWRDYFDRNAADRSIKGDPLPDHIANLVGRVALPGLGG